MCVQVTMNNAKGFTELKCSRKIRVGPRRVSSIACRMISQSRYGLTSTYIRTIARLPYYSYMCTYHIGFTENLIIHDQSNSEYPANLVPIQWHFGIGHLFTLFGLRSMQSPDCPLNEQSGSFQPNEFSPGNIGCSRRVHQPIQFKAPFNFVIFDCYPITRDGLSCIIGHTN